MNFIRYLKDRLGFTIIYFFNTIIIILVMQLANIIEGNFTSGSKLIYSLILACSFYSIYITYSYLRKKQYYKTIKQINESEALSELINFSETKNHEHHEIQLLLENIYRIHKTKLVKYEENSKHYRYFINQWVHQMKTPVSVLHLLINDQAIALNQKKSMEEELEKITQGLDLMLYHGRLNNFVEDFKIEKTAVLPIIRNAINQNKKLFIRYSIYPKIETDEEVYLETDGKWIIFILNQIIYNSIKYMKLTNKEPKYIYFDIKKSNEKKILQIRDEGIGIPSEDLGRIFNPFFTGKNGRKTSESTGMGLYLCKKACTMLGHHIYATSEEEKGTTIYIEFIESKNLYKL